MSDDLPAALERCVNHRPSLQADLGVHRAGRWHAELVEDVEHAPDADPLAVFAPRPVRVVIDISRQIAADDTGTPGIERLRRILSHVPVFEIGRDHDSESLPVRPPKRLSLGNRHKLVFHGSHSRPVKHPDETTRFRGLLSNIDPNLRTSFKTPQAGAQALEFCP